MTEHPTLSDLPKTWLIDVDGVLFTHNGYLTSSEESPLPSVLEFFAALPDGDDVILLSARPEQYRAQTEAALARWGIPYRQLILDLPVGERVLVNDTKPRGLRTAVALNVPRDAGLGEACRLLDEATPAS